MKGGALRTPRIGPAQHVIAATALVMMLVAPLVLIGGAASDAVPTDRPNGSAVGTHGAQPTAGPDGRARSLQRTQLVSHEVTTTTTTSAPSVSTTTAAPVAAPVTPTTTYRPVVVATTPPTTVAPTTTTRPPPAHRITGVATWYHWRSGQCASPSIAFGTTITVTNVATGASATCTVTDREGSTPGRILDLDVSVFSAIASLSAGALTVTVAW